MTDTTTQEPEGRRLPGLLASIFDRMRKDNQASGKAQERIMEEFSERLHEAFAHVHAEAREREKLLEEKLELLEREEAYRLRRVKLLSFPAIALALACLGYLFYVVHVMEKSMSSMAGNMTVMRGSMENMSGHTGSMSDNVAAMNQQMGKMNSSMDKLNSNVGNISQDVGSMNHNVGYMGREVGQMSQTVSPMMGGLRSFMPF